MFGVAKLLDDSKVLEFVFDDAVASMFGVSRSLDVPELCSALT